MHPINVHRYIQGIYTSTLAGHKSTHALRSRAHVFLEFVEHGCCLQLRRDRVVSARGSVGNVKARLGRVCLQLHHLSPSAIARDGMCGNIEQRVAKAKRTGKPDASDLIARNYVMAQRGGVEGKVGFVPDDQEIVNLLEGGLPAKAATLPVHAVLVVNNTLLVGGENFMFGSKTPHL